MKKEQWSLKNRQTNDSKQQEGEEDAPVTLQEVCLQWLVRLLSFLAFAAGTRYILWRWSRIIATSYWLSLPFVICEGCLILLGSGAFYLQTIRYKKRARKRMSDLKMQADDLPTVDVMIPCYHEPLEVIRRTVMAALQIDWPPEKLTVLLLDDGGSAEAKQMVEDVAKGLRIGKIKGHVPQLGYIARLRKHSEPHHAKAGNLNNAILATSGDFILVLDCDMCVKPEILDALMPHFYVEKKDDAKKNPEEGGETDYDLEERVAMVQSPQAFSIVQRGDPLNNKSLLFYHVLMPGWDGWGAAPCCGTNVLFLRQALESIGGFTYGSVTEDFLTSLTLHSSGFRSKYVDEVLAYGLAPDGVDSFFAQRLRWAVGGLQICLYFNPLLKSGQLTIPQRLLYAWSGGYPLLAFPTAIVMCTPFLFLLDDGRLLLTTGTVREYIHIFFPFYLLHNIVSAINHAKLGRQGLLYFWRSQQESAYMLFTYMKATFVVALGLQFTFKVTNKDVGKRGDRFKDLAHALPHIIFLLVGIASVITGLLQMIASHMKHDLFTAYCINISWAVLILFGLWPPVATFLGFKGYCLCPAVVESQQARNEIHASGLAAYERINDDYPSAGDFKAMEGGIMEEGKQQVKGEGKGSINSNSSSSNSQKKKKKKSDMDKEAKVSAVEKTPLLKLQSNYTPT